jgi:glucosamine kinase
VHGDHRTSRHVNLKKRNVDMTLHHRALGLDIGGSASRWHLVMPEADATPRSGITAGFSGHLFKRDVLAEAQAALEEIANATGPVDAVIAGVTGLSKGTAEAHEMARMITQAFGAKHITVMSDIELAYRAAFEPGAGILVYAGTGSIAAHLALDGTLLTAGGKGVLIDDAGGGYWIAVQALRQVLRAEDAQPGSGWTTSLGQCLAADLGGTDWPTVRQAVYKKDRGGIGMLAPCVSRAALTGDQLALGILDASGRELGLLATMLDRRIAGNADRRPVALAGRAGALHPAILVAMRTALQGRTVDLATLDAAKCAAVMAGVTPFLPLSTE